MSNYFFRKDSSKYSIIAGGDSIEKCFVTFRERKSGIMLINFRADEYLKDDESLAKFIEYLNAAASLEGEKLEAHLEGFLPLSHLKTEDFSSVIGASQTEKTLSGVSIARLMMVSSITDVNEYLTIMQDLHGSLSDFKLSVRDPLESMLLEVEIEELKSEIKTLLDSNGVGAISYFQKMYKIKSKLTSGVFGEAAHDLDETSKDGRVFSGAVSALHYRLLPSMSVDFGNSTALARYLSVKSSSHLLPLHDGYEDYNDALKDLVMGGSDIISYRELDETGLFGGASGGKFSRTLYGSPIVKNGPARAKRGTFDTVNMLRGCQATILQYISSIDSPKEKRNTIQILRSIGFGIGVATRYGEFVEYARDHINNGANLSKSLWEYMRLNVGSEALREGGRDKFGKKETQILLNNIGAMNDIVLHGQSSTIRTFEGESINIAPLSRDEMVSHFVNNNKKESKIDPSAFVDGREISNGYNANIAKYAKASLADKNGDEVFSGYVDIGNLSDTFSSIFALSDMPSNALSRVEHLKGIVETFAHHALVNDLCKGGLRLRNGEIKDRNLYSGPWRSITNIIDKEIYNNPSLARGDTALRIGIQRDGILSDYRTSTKTWDAIRMLSQALTAMKTKYLPDTIPINYGNSDFDLCSAIGEVERVTALGINFDFDKRDVENLISEMNYNSSLRLADKAHSNYGQMKKMTSPNTDISWGKSLPDIAISDTKGRNIVVASINSHRGVIEEGADMDHCISSYSSRCAKGEYMAFSVSVDGDKCATLGMSVEYNDVIYDQLQGPGNTPVDPDIKSAIEEQFIHPLVNDHIVQGKELVFSDAGQSSQEVSGAEALAIILDYELEDDRKFEMLRDYVVSILGEDTVFEMISKEIDSLEQRVKEEYSDQGNLPVVLNKISNSREALYCDFRRCRDSTPRL